MTRTGQNTPTPENTEAPAARPRLGSAIVYAADAETRQSLTRTLEDDGFGVLDLEVAEECFAVLPALAAPAAIVFALGAHDDALWGRILEAAATSDHIFFALLGDLRPVIPLHLPANVVLVDSRSDRPSPAAHFTRAALH